MPHSFPDWLLKQSPPNEERLLVRGEVLFRAGDPVTKLYLVKCGEIHLVRPLSHGDCLTLHRALPGAVLAEASLFSPRYHCDAQAERDCELICYSLQSVRQSLRSDPAFAERLCAHFAREIQSLRTKLELTHIQSADERLLTWIRLHAAPETATVPIDRSLKSIASELGLAHETLYRSLKRLEARQLIRREAKWIVLLTDD